MWADILTKEMKMPEALEKVLMENVMILQRVNVNEVKAFDKEVRIENIRNRAAASKISSCSSF